MAFRVAVRASRQLACRSRCMPVSLLSTWRPPTALISAQNDCFPPSVTRQLSCFFHTSAAKRSSHIVTIQDEKDFDSKVLKSQTPVLVDFFATWCGPCKMLIPRLETLVSGKDGKVLLAKIDIDEHTDLAMNYEVQAVPTVIGMKDGKVVDRFVGLKDEADLETFVKKLMG